MRREKDRHLDILRGVRRKRHRRHYKQVTDIERSHDELRAAIILAGKEIRKLNFGKRDTPVLRKLRQVLRESRNRRWA
jgi:hypothetical protein